MTDTSLFAFGFTHNRKIRRLSDAAFRLWVSAIDHANQDGTDGLVVAEDIECYPRAPRGKARDEAIAELVTLSLWHTAGDGRWVIHDFLEWQLSAEERASEVLAREERLTRERERVRAVRALVRTHVHLGEQGSEPGGRQGVNVVDDERTSGVSPFPPDPLSDRKESESLGSESTSGIRISDRPAKKGSARARRTQLPGDWRPTVEHEARAAAEGLDLAAEAERFRLHAEATGRAMANWNAAFTTWLMNAKRFAPRGLPRRGTVPQPSHGRTGFEDA